MAYRQLMDRFGHTQEKLAEGLSKSRSHIANIMRLLQLPDGVLTYLREGKLTAGHARALITSENAEELARKIIAKGLSVREAERLVKAPPKGPPRPRSVTEKDADTRALEQDLSANLGMKVQIDHRSIDGDGTLTLHYRSLEQLDELCRILSVSPLDVSR
jgi:ParB family chromosome partitioning protein